jgi:diacylglycerol kinase (ATP)
MHEPENETGYVGRRFTSFRNAGRGIGPLLGEPNARIHAAATIAVIGLATWLGVGAVEGALLALAIALVWTAEALNTSLERLADATVPERRPQVGTAKDVGALAVSVAALGAVVVALFVFGPHVARLFD